MKPEQKRTKGTRGRGWRERDDDGKEERRGGRDGGGKCEVVAIRIKLIKIIIIIKTIILIMLVSRLLLDTAN
ncbi:hypothetical protein BO85DRAFT_218266 [Aspergillus piperis CBS 112811]|uniref:Uncharacterized protein n=1 Tax=Aspergillus piperis CBS 112811 TaxID=1448313 RepID=A0A8G1VNS2_9EURO|nr:hypothetical protein BO85DRAFT_218266 [Aspergillus piperis CBS 112811]RAH60066.1 hypothetical protein BO85DRAFT_218266 [Aspergillus piperis CBS 112811]